MARFKRGSRNAVAFAYQAIENGLRLKRASRNVVGNRNPF